MKILDLLGRLLWAPACGLAGALLGMLLASLVLLADYILHRVLGWQYAGIARAIDAGAGYLPALFGIGGFLAGLFPQSRTAWPVFGSARWATGKEIAALARRGRLRKRKIKHVKAKRLRRWASIRLCH